jgi:bifunctional DNA-binding transcriptional regulator/antitoxin component of YhaV-PrlF toxin-antitoxin module
MQIQVVFKAGNSSVIALPKDLGFKPGDKVIVDRGLKIGTAFVSKAGVKQTSYSITPEFLKILDGINKRYGKALNELALK